MLAFLHHNSFTNCLCVPEDIQGDWLNHSLITQGRTKGGHLCPASYWNCQMPLYLSSSELKYRLFVFFSKLKLCKHTTIFLTFSIFQIQNVYFFTRNVGEIFKPIITNDNHRFGILVFQSNGWKSMETLNPPTNYLYSDIWSQVKSVDFVI